MTYRVNRGRKLVTMLKTILPVPLLLWAVIQCLKKVEKLVFIEIKNVSKRYINTFMGLEYTLYIRV